MISRHRQPARHREGEGRERRAALLHQPAAADAGRRQAERAAQHQGLHPPGQGSGHRSQPPLLPRQRSK